MLQALSGADNTAATGSGDTGGGVTPGLVYLVDADCTRTAGSARFRLTSTGLAQRYSGSGYVNLYTWKLSGLNSDYQTRATVTGGVLTLGSAANTWYPLTADVYWGSDDAVIRVEIRQVSSGTVLASCNVILLFDPSISDPFR